MATAHVNYVNQKVFKHKEEMNNGEYSSSCLKSSPPKAGMQKYLDLAAMLKPLLSRILKALSGQNAFPA